MGFMVLQNHSRVRETRVLQWFRFGLWRSLG